MTAAGGQQETADPLGRVSQWPQVTFDQFQLRGRFAFEKYKLRCRLCGSVSVYVSVGC